MCCAGTVYPSCSHTVDQEGNVTLHYARPCTMTVRDLLSSRTSKGLTVPRQEQVRVLGRLCADCHARWKKTQAAAMCAAAAMVCAASHISCGTTRRTPYTSYTRWACWLASAPLSRPLKNKPYSWQVPSVNLTPMLHVCCSAVLPVLAPLPGRPI